jgi:cellulose biosynthesis protein BcsQ
MYKEKTFTTIIDQDVKIKESQIMNTPVMYYDKRSISAQQYLDLAEEILHL